MTWAYTHDVDLFNTDKAKLMPLGSLTWVSYGTKILTTHHKVDQR